MENTAIDINALKDNYEDDPLPFHIWSIAIDCKRRRDAYWRHYKKMKTRANIVSIPLLILTSVTGLTSVANLSTDTNDKSTNTNPLALPIVVTIFGVSSAVISALQRYFRYSERGEHSKHMAKSYGRIARRIENTMVLLKSEATTMKSESFQKFVEEVQKDTESLLQETDDVPKELLNEKNIYRGMLDSLKTHTKTIFLSKNHIKSQPISQVQHISDHVNETEFQEVNLRDLENMTIAAARMAPSSTDIHEPHLLESFKQHPVVKSIEIADGPTQDVIQELHNRWEKVKRMRQELEQIESTLEQAKKVGNSNEAWALTSLLAELRKHTKQSYEETIEFAKENKLEYLCE